MSEAGLLAVNAVLLGIMLITAVTIARQRNLFVATMLSSIFSLSMACLFVVLDAVDVALTEAAVGAGISAVLMLSALALTRFEDRPPRPFAHWTALVACLGLGALLMYAASGWTRLGAADTPVQTHPLTSHYLQRSAEEIDIPNVVTSVLASYRGFDTLGEVTVVLTAALAVMLLLRAPIIRHSPPAPTPGRDNNSRNTVLRVVTKNLMPVILLYALYVQFHGEYSPGGGFQAGVIFAAGVVLYALVFGLERARRVVPARVMRGIAPLGVLLYAGVGVYALLRGRAFLDYSALSPADPVHGQHLGIILVELGVGLTVAASMVLIFYAFTTRRRSST